MLKIMAGLAGLLGAVGEVKAETCWPALDLLRLAGSKSGVARIMWLQPVDAARALKFVGSNAAHALVLYVPGKRSGMLYVVKDGELCSPDILMAGPFVKGSK